MDSNDGYLIENDIGRCSNLGMIHEFVPGPNMILENVVEAVAVAVAVVVTINVNLYIHLLLVPIQMGRRNYCKSVVMTIFIIVGLPVTIPYYYQQQYQIIPNPQRHRPGWFHVRNFPTARNVINKI